MTLKRYGISVSFLGRSFMKIAVITGGSRGIGRSIAIHSAKRGIGVIITYNTQASEAAQVVDRINSEGGRAASLQLNSANIKELPHFEAQLKKCLSQQFNSQSIDVLVNNAGVSGQRGPILETTEQAFDEVFNINLKGPFFLTQKLVPLIAEGGQIINISSGLARFAFPNVAVYGALKSALEGFTRYFAKEFASRKIRANTVAPGPVDTEFGGGKDQNAKKLMSDMTAMSRIATADDVGKFVAGLMSDDSQFLNGQRIEISGGMYL